jgi:hypothetical protein
VALIRTLFGDTEADVKYQKTFMGVGQLDFQLPLDDPMVQAGGFNAWRPLGVRLYDGLASLDVACWSVFPRRSGALLQVTAYDAARWLQRRTAVRVTAVPQTAGQHVADLFANAEVNREERRPAVLFPRIATSTGEGQNAWVYEVPDPTDPTKTVLNHYDLNVPIGQVWASVKARSAAHDLAYRQADLSGIRFTTTEDPTAVKLRIWAYAAPGVKWNNRVQLSVDNGDTWGPSHPIPAPSQLVQQFIDLTEDRAWTADDLYNVRIRLTEEADADYADEVRWNIFYVGIQVEFGEIYDNWPLVQTEIETGGPTLTLPEDRKSLLDWLLYLNEQTGYEFANSSSLNRLGYSGLTWRPRIGTDVLATVQVEGLEIPVASLEENQNLNDPGTVGVDGALVFSQVRVTAQGLPDVVRTNLALAKDIGIHETVIDLGNNVTATEQSNRADLLLQQASSPSMSFSVKVPRIPGLWSALQLGNTVLTRIQQAPVLPWEGTTRILGWNLDETAGVLGLDLVTMQDAVGSEQPVGQGYRVYAGTAQRQAIPTQKKRRQVVWWYRLLAKLAR